MKKTRSKYSYKRADQHFPSLSLDNFIHVCNVIWSFSAPPLPTPLLPTLNPFYPSSPLPRFMSHFCPVCLGFGFL